MIQRTNRERAGNEQRERERAKRKKKERAGEERDSSERAEREEWRQRRENLCLLIYISKKQN